MNPRSALGFMFFECGAAFQWALLACSLSRRVTPVTRGECEAQEKIWAAHCDWPEPWSQLAMPCHAQ